MSQASQIGFSWSGSLQETNIRALYERCQRLRITGYMRLKQGEAVLDLMWVGGEPIENEGDQGTRSLPLWNNGEFQVEQRMPDFKGQLTTGVEMTGPLRAGQIQAIYKLCADNVLSADVDLLRENGEAAQVRFTLGKAEIASINSQTEGALSALSKLSGWNDGTFRVLLKPLFGDTAVAEAPVFKDKKDSSGDQFDFTGSVNVDVSKGPVDWPPGLAESAGVGAPVPMGGPMPAPAARPAPAPAPAPSAPPAAVSNSGSASPVPPRLAATLISPPKAAASPLPTNNSTAATVPMSQVSRAEAAKQMLAQAQAQAQLQKPASSLGKTLAIISVLIILCCAGVIGAIMYLRR